MPNYTDKLNLVKPLESEFYDVEVFNENADKIDSSVGDVTTLTTTSKEVVGAINELDSEKADNSDIGNRTYTEQNVVTNGESITNSINGLDVAINDKANKVQENWKIAVLQNGWAGTFQYRKNSIGQLEIQGQLLAGAVTSLTTIAELPLGYRPIRMKTIPISNSSNGSYTGLALQIHPNGVLRVPASTLPSTGTYYDISDVMV